MKYSKLKKLATGLGISMLAACSSPESRINDDKAAFDSYPPQTQATIRAGQVNIGFTPQMARMALGDPDRRYTRTTAAGTSEVWAYTKSSPVFSFGIGGGSFGGGGGLGGGVGVSTGGDAPDDKIRLIFENGLVTATETNVQ